LAASLGAVAYILKPKEPDILWQEVEETLAGGGNLQTAVESILFKAGEPRVGLSSSLEID